VKRKTEEPVPPRDFAAAAALCGINEETLRGLFHGRYRVEPNAYTHQHKVRGSSYQVVAVALLQNATGRTLLENDQLVVYRTHAESWWVRHIEEFEDGRFELLRRPQVMPDPLTTELADFVPAHYPDTAGVSVRVGLLRRILKRLT